MTFAKRLPSLFRVTLVCVALLFGSVAVRDTGSRAALAATPEPTAPATAGGESLDLPVIADQIVNSPHKVVKSADGRLQLLIPDGALPADVPITQVKITAIRPAQVPVKIAGTAPQIAYRLEPDGLQFSSMALAVLTINAPADGSLPLLSTLSGENLSVIDTVWYRTDPKTRKLIITAPLTHFSDLLSSRGLFAVFMKSILDHVQNNTFDVEADVSRVKPSPIRRWELSGVWAALSPVVPSKLTDNPPKTALEGDKFTVRQKFTCQGLSPYARIDYTASTQFELVVDVKGTTKTYKLDQTLTFSRTFLCQRMVRTLTATFANFTTTFTVYAAHPELDKLTYTWSNSNGCGEFLVTAKSNIAKWIHPHTNEPGACPEEGIKHPGQITVVVTDGRGATETVVYTEGSAVGACTFGATDEKEITGPCTIQASSK